MSKEKLQEFLLKARTKTYAGGGGKVAPALAGSIQLEYREEDWFYRDLYYTGNGIFMGLETIYWKDKPIWSMSYYGNFKKITEEEVDRILRKALLENWQTTRLWNYVEWEFEEYKYVCTPDFQGSIDEVAGVEKISKAGAEVYSFYYAGGFIGEIEA
jgi:ABC-type transport system substrate-binding protein